MILDLEELSLVVLLSVTHHVFNARYSILSCDFNCAQWSGSRRALIDYLLIAHELLLLGIVVLLCAHVSY